MPAQRTITMSTMAAASSSTLLPSRTFFGHRCFQRNNALQCHPIPTTAPPPPPLLIFAGKPLAGGRAALPAALLFDCDGVLVDTEKDGHRISSNETFAELQNVGSTASMAAAAAPKDGFLGARFRSAAALAGWDKEALLHAALIVEDTPVRESRHKKRPPGGSTDSSTRSGDRGGGSRMRSHPSFVHSTTTRKPTLEIRRRKWGRKRRRLLWWKRRKWRIQRRLRRGAASCHVWIASERSCLAQ